MKDLISIIIPVYNVEAYLDKCIESIINQTYSNLEIILIDDGSTDSSGIKCDEWAEKDHRIVVVHKENEGVSNARNTGLKVAKGEYIGFIDSDDYIEQNMYEIMYTEMNKDNIEFVLCDFKKVKFKEEKNACPIQHYSYENIDKFQVLLEFYPLAGSVCRCLFSRAKLSDIIFDTTLYIGEDLDFICRYILNSKNSSIYVKEKMYNYVVREGSTTRKNTSKNERLKSFIDFKNTKNHVKSIIIEKCENKEIIKIIEKRTLMYYWKDLYEMLEEKLDISNEIIDEFCSEIEGYKQYHTIKDKFYRLLLKINPKAFEIVYKNVKKIKHR